MTTHPMPVRRLSTLAGLVAALLLSLGAAAAEEKSWFRERFIDPADGQFDASNYLLDYKGALPVPIIITEPAIGYGGGLALAWFKESMREAAEHAKEGGKRVTPPTILVAALFGTENGTKGGAFGGRASFVDDTWRYRGGAGLMSVNLDFYGLGGGLSPAFSKIGYNLKGFAVVNELTRRLGDTNQFFGVRQVYLDFDSKLDIGTAEDAGLTSRSFTQKNSALGVTYVYDSRDNIFTTTKGVDASLDAVYYSPRFGGDTSFKSYRAHAFAYIPTNEKLTVALRVDGRTARGDVPFYQYPFVDMRGIPAARYQDENVGILEAELRYYVTPRWIVLGFLGGARAWGLKSNFSDEGTVVAKGAGFRYMVARRLNLSVGIDVARGPEDSAFYIQVGNAWR